MNLLPLREEHCTHPDANWCDCDWCRVVAKARRDATRILLSEWIARNPSVLHYDGGDHWRIYSDDPTLWHLRDYVVSSSVSGPSVVLVPRREGS